MLCCTLSTSDLPQPVVRVESDGDSTAGEDFSLQCTVETEEGVRLEDISIQWTGPDGGQISSGGNIVIGNLTTDGTVTTGSLQFSPLRTSDRGQYTCTGRVAASSVEVNVSNSDSIVVNVTSTFSPVLCSGIHVHVCMCTTCLHVIVISLYPSVPAPVVSVSLNTNDPVYQGTVLVLSCTATVNSAVNTSFTVDITLTSEPDTLNGRYVSITNTSDSELEFTRAVEFRPVNTSAIYTCTASIAPTASDSDSVLASTSNTSTVSITVEGESAQEVHVLSDSKQFSHNLLFLLQS